MAEYIEREALLKILKIRIKGQHQIYDTANMILSLVEDYVNEIPAADVVDVRHGEWINGVTGYTCSVCDKQEPTKRFLYCPNCGAKMDGKDDSSEQMHRY